MNFDCLVGLAQVYSLKTTNSSLQHTLKEKVIRYNGAGDELFWLEMRGQEHCCNSPGRGQFWILMPLKNESKLLRATPKQ